VIHIVIQLTTACARFRLSDTSDVHISGILKISHDKTSEFNCLWSTKYNLMRVTVC